MKDKRDSKRQRQRAWVAQRRKEWLDVNGPCKHCGLWERLEIDHIDPTTKVSHSVFSWRKERREAELAKCQVLCYDCHKAKTAVDMATLYKRQVNHIHGTTTEYRRGCRCEPCKTAKYEAVKDYRSRCEYARQHPVAA